jgi:hypothetical protein
VPGCPGRVGERSPQYRGADDCRYREKPMAKGMPASMLIGDNSPRYQRDNDRPIASTGAPSTIRTEETSPRGDVEPR